MLGVIAASGGRIKLADYHQITAGCRWSNCTNDGGHRARFVNRAKAQVVLAQLCPERRRTSAAASPNGLFRWLYQTWYDIASVFG